MKGTPLKTGLAGLALAAAVMGFAGAALAQEPGTDNQARRLEPIVVTATRMEEKASEQASAVSVVSREEIDVTSPVVAGDALQTIPGVVVQRAGTPGNRENVKIRGGLSEHTLVMIDGFKVNSPTLGTFDIGSLSLDDFDRVEVVRGAQSALYGSNAMSGVVNFIPRKGEAGRQYGAGLFGGSYNTVKGNGYGQGAGSWGNFHLGGSSYRSDGQLPNDDAFLASFLGTGEVRVGRRNRLHLLVLSTDEDKGIPISFNLPRDLNQRFTRRSVLTGARWETEVSKTVAITASWDVFNEFFHDSLPPGPGVFPFDDLTRTRKLDLRLEGRISPCPASTTFVGMEYEKDRGTENDALNGIALAASTFNRSVYLQEELRPAKNAGISLGARLDRNSEAGTEFNPKGAAFYLFEGIGTKLRAAVGRGFRVPTISNKFFPFIGNPDLKPERAVSYEGGVDVTLMERKAVVSATWFYQDFRDLITFDFETGRNRNANRAFARGIESEVAIRVVPEALVLLAYTYTDTWDPAKQRRIPGIPTHRGTASLSLIPAPRWQTRLDWKVEGDQVDAPLFSGRTRRSGYARLDAFATYKWVVPGADVREIALTGKVQNLLNRHYEERIDFPAPGINFLVGADVRI